MSENVENSLFNFCPSCGAREIEFKNGKEFLCRACGFDYFHNVATAAGTIIVSTSPDLAILCLVRAKEPGKGLLCLPGGFIDPGESAEAAVIRECREEIGIAPEKLVFFGSYPNRYEYKGIVYNTCDLIFTGKLPKQYDKRLIERPESSQVERLDSEEVSEVFWLNCKNLDPERFAFGSLRAAIRDWLLTSAIMHQL